MPLDLTAFNKPQSAIVPILNRSFQYKRKKYRVDHDDGWHEVEMIGNNARAKCSYSCQMNECMFDYVSGYVFGNQIVFANADVARRKWQKSMTDVLWFNSSDSFSSVKAVVWEDGRVYYAGINYGDVLIFLVKQAYDNDCPVNGIKHLTPELRHIYLFHDLERQQIREIIKQQAEKQRLDELMKSTPGRLATILGRAGARLISWTQQGDRFVVEWELLNGGYRYNSLLDSKWRIIEAGICLSGDDKRHNLTTLAVTAKIYEDEHLIHRTRT